MLRRMIRTLKALKLLAQFPRHADAPRHRLPGQLVVSLTSYPARFRNLDRTIKSLLDQTVRPDRVILWLDEQAVPLLPRSVRDLEGELFQVRGTRDIRSYTKIIPALAAFPDAFIVVADDDIYYPDNWLKGLVDAYDPANPAIVYHRGHRIAHRADGSLEPHRRWQREVRDEQSLLPSTDVMPTGVGGVMYPPGSLPPQTQDVSLFKQLSETCDDSWLYFMWRQNGWKARRTTTPQSKLVTWPGTQEHSLMSFHYGGKKDEHLRALSEHFGTP